MALSDELEFDEQKIRLGLANILGDVIALGAQYDELTAQKEQALAAGDDTTALNDQISGVSEAMQEANTQLVEGAEKLNEFGGEAQDASKDAKGLGDSVKTSIKDFKVFGLSINNVSAKFKGFAASAKASGRSLKTLSGATKLFSRALIAVPIFLVIAAIATLIGYFTRTQEGMDKITRVTAQLGAVLDVFIDRALIYGKAMFDLGAAVIKLFQGDFKGAADSFQASMDGVRESFTGIGEEIAEEFRQAGLLADVIARIEKETINLRIARAATDAELKTLNRTAEDTTKGYGVRLKALEEFTDKETTLTQRQIDNQKLRVATLLGETEVTQQVLDKLKQIKEEGVELGDLGLSTSTNVDAEEFATEFEKLAALTTRSEQLLTRSQTRRNSILREVAAKRAKEIEAERKRVEALEKEYLSLFDSFNDALNSARTSGLTDQDKLDNDRDESIKAIEKVYADLQEAALAAGKDLDLSSELSEVLLQIDEDYKKQTLDLQLKNATDEIKQQKQIDLLKLEQLTESKDSELSLVQFKAEQKKRIELLALEDQAAAIVAVFGDDSFQLKLIEAQIANVRKGAADSFDIRKKAIDDAEKLALQENESIEKSGDVAISLETFKEKGKTEILIEAARQRLAIIQEEYGPDSTEAQLQKGQIAAYQAALDNLANERLGFLEKFKAKIIDSLDISPEVFEQGIGILNSAVADFSEGINAQLDAEISKTQNLIDSINRRIEAKEKEIEEEQKLADAGSDIAAQNVENLENQLAGEEAARTAAIQKKYELEKKAANRQIAIDTAQQISALGLAAAQLLASEASKGIVGIVLAFGAAALLFSTVQKVKAQAEASPPPQLRTGGPISAIEGLLTGPSHENNGIPAAYQDRYGNQRLLELEGQEYVMPTGAAKQYHAELEAMRKGDYQRALPQQQPKIVERITENAKDYTDRFNALEKAIKNNTRVIEERPVVTPEGGHTLTKKIGRDTIIKTTSKPPRLSRRARS